MNISKYVDKIYIQRFGKPSNAISFATYTHLVNTYTHLVNTYSAIYTHLVDTYSDNYFSYPSVTLLQEQFNTLDCFKEQFNTLNCIKQKINTFKQTQEYSRYMHIYEEVLHRFTTYFNNLNTKTLEDENTLPLSNIY